MLEFFKPPIASGQFLYLEIFRAKRPLQFDAEIERKIKLAIIAITYAT